MDVSARLNYLQWWPICKDMDSQDLMSLSVVSKRMQSIMKNVIAGKAQEVFANAIFSVDVDLKAVQVAANLNVHKEIILILFRRF